MSEKILITGGAGFIGRKVSEKLNKKGYKVLIIDNVEPKGLSKDIEYKKIDLKNQSSTLSAFKKIDICINLAAKIGPVGYMSEFPAQILFENSLILSSTFNAAHKNGLKQMFYASSSMVYQKATKYPVFEKDLDKTVPPTNIYGFSKLLGEYYCKAYWEEFGLSYTIFRLFNVYGIGENLSNKEGFSHVIPDLIRKIVSGQYPLEILGDGKDTRSFTHIDDVTDAICLLIKKRNKVKNEDFNIGSNREISILQLAELLWKLSGRKEKFKVKYRPSFSHPTAKRRSVNPLKIKNLGWQEKVRLENGLSELIDYFKGKND